MRATLILLAVVATYYTLRRETFAIRQTLHNTQAYKLQTSIHRGTYRKIPKRGRYAIINSVYCT